MNDKITVTTAYLGDAFCSTMGAAKALVEGHIYAWCGMNVSNYAGGVWETVALPNGAVYRRMAGSEEQLTIHNPGAFWEGQVSKDMMGIVATCVAINQTLWAVYETHPALGREMDRLFYLLRNWALVNHPESQQLAAALD